MGYASLLAARLDARPSKRYRLDSAMHHSSRGTVWRGTDLATGGAVVIKRGRNAPLELINLREARGCGPSRVQALHEDRLVPDDDLDFNGFGKAVGAPVLALRAHGEALSPRKDCETDADVRRELRDCFLAVAELHSRTAMAHLDVKGSNFVRPGPPGGPSGADACGGAGGAAGAVLIDFELAVHSPAKGAPRRGTPVFMSPAMVSRGEASQLCDAWALGVMAFQCCHRGAIHPFLLDSSGKYRESQVMGPDGFPAVNAVRDVLVAFEFDPEGMWENPGAPLALELCEGIFLAGWGVDRALRHPLLE